MKAVLMSIHPKWCEKIFNGEKTIEVRKSVPKLKTPFTVYVYQTKYKFEKGDSRLVVDAMNEITAGGKVIGSFVCDYVAPIAYAMDGVADFIDCRNSCLSPTDFVNYGKGKPLYGWHITEPKLFEKPKEVTEFMLGGGWNAGRFPLTRPPQSWCYVEE